MFKKLFHYIPLKALVAINSIIWITFIYLIEEKLWVFTFFILPLILLFDKMAISKLLKKATPGFIFIIRRLGILYVCICIAIFSRMFIGEVYVVPTESMKDSILPGDIIWLNKFSYGIHLPTDWKDIPFLGSFIKSDIKDSLSSKKESRLFIQYKDVQRGDIVVFKHTSSLDKKLIKRCIGIPGDIIRIIDDELFNNNQPMVPVETAIFPFQINFNYCSELELKENQKLNNQKIYFISQKEITSNKDSVKFTYKKCIDENSAKSIYPIFPIEEKNVWNIQNYGPLNIEKNTNSYFLMGDNRHRSIDSRYLGLIHQDLILGRAIFVFFNIYTYDRFMKLL